jgi:hypothetical protein
MSFVEKYPRLWNFFAAYFSDADLNNLTDEVVVAEYKSEIQENDLQQVVAELDKLIVDTSCWEQAADDANRYFATQEENLAWLRMVRRELAG